MNRTIKYALTAALVGAAFLLPGCGSGSLRTDPVLSAFSPGGVQDGDPNGELIPNYLTSIAASRWRKSVVTWRLVNPPTFNGSFVKSQLRTGIAKWNAPLDGLVSIQEAQGSDPEDITVEFVKPGSIGGSLLGIHNLGQTSYTFTGGNPTAGIDHAHISLSSGLIATPGSLIKGMGHEFGHALGIRGHSPNAGDLMYASYEGVANRTVDDYETMRAIYRN